MKLLLHVAALLVATVVVAAENRWAGFYPAETLRYWSMQIPPGIEENYREVLLPKLTSAELRKIGKVTLQFPLEDASHPMNFYSNPETRTMYFPVSSMRFFGDIALAYAWLDAKNFSLDPVTDYLGILKYQWPGSLRDKPYRPHDALGIPANARDDAYTYKTFQNAYKSAMIFIIGHELGHIYHQSKSYSDISPEKAQQQESECDEFSIELLRRVGVAPMGITLFFSSVAHLQLVAGDRDYATQMSQRTHPLSGARLGRVAAAMRLHVDDMARTEANIPKARTAILAAAKEIEGIGALIDDPGIQMLWRQKGQSAHINSLKPRRVGEISAVAPARTSPAGLAFDGVYDGTWLDAKGTDLPGKMTLTRTGNRVKGTYTFGVGNMDIYEGDVIAGVLNFKWRWGTDYFGRGTLKAGATGDELTGTWGYNDKSEGSGSWKLSRQNVLPDASPTLRR